MPLSFPEVPLPYFRGCRAPTETFQYTSATVRTSAPTADIIENYLLLKEGLLFWNRNNSVYESTLKKKEKNKKIKGEEKE